MQTFLFDAVPKSSGKRERLGSGVKTMFITNMYTGTMIDELVETVRRAEEHALTERAQRTEVFYRDGYAAYIYEQPMIYDRPRVESWPALEIGVA